MTAALIIWAAGVLLAWPTLTAYGHPYHDWADAVTVTAIAFVAALLWPVLAIVGLYDLATLPARRRGGRHYGLTRHGVHEHHLPTEASR